jgi:hypothetical protein
MSLPEWVQPDNYLGQAVPIQFVLARSEKGVIAVLHLVAYPTGFEFQLVALVRSDMQNEDSMLGFIGRPYYSKPNPDPARLPDELFRFGIQFPDGSKATTLQERRVWFGSDRPKAPLLQPTGSGYSGPRQLSMGYWVWPLPPAGPFAVVCEWPALGIPLTRHEIDSSVIREAALKARPLWRSDGGG